MKLVSVILSLVLCVCTQSSYCLGSEPAYFPADESMRKAGHVASVEYHGDGANVAARQRRDTDPTTTPSMDTTPAPAEIVTIEDDHQYYSSVFHTIGQEYFIDLSLDDTTTIIHEALSSSHLTAGEVRLPFEFPFYGHNISKIYIATGGFVSLSTFFHQYLSATQYIAPLMGNFDPSLNGSSQIKYGYNDTAFTVEWDDLHVQHIQDAGRFTFQTTLMSDGRILFAYKTIPESVNNIGGGNGHKVTVGLSDGYYIDEPLFPGSKLVKRTIYHYHNVQLNKTHVMAGAAFVLTPFKTCNLYTNCTACLDMRELIEFDCGWCSKIQRCSSGMDRHRQEWIEADCSTDPQDGCDYIAFPTSSTAPNWPPLSVSNDHLVREAIIIVCVIIAVIVFGLIMCLVYALKYPMTRSGQQLIQFQQRVRQGIRRKPQDNYRESIVGSMQESKPTPPPTSYSPHETPAVILPTPSYSPNPSPTSTPSHPSTGGDSPAVITTTAAPGATIAGNGNAPTANLGPDLNAHPSEC